MRNLIVICGAFAVATGVLSACGDVESLDDLGRRLDPIPALEGAPEVAPAQPVREAGDGEITQTTLDESVAAPAQSGYHIVVEGETAESIAALHNVSEDALAAWNGLNAAHSVEVGQQLLIPFDASEIEPVAPEPAEPEVADTAQFFPPVNGEIVRPFSNTSGGNEGIDLSAPQGTPVRAGDDGEVALTSQSVNDTTIILVRHDDVFYTVYSNVTAPSVAKGDKIKRGQAIGVVASDFVHFEVRKGVDAVDPAPYIGK